jgi:hypothetical protein
MTTDASDHPDAQGSAGQLPDARPILDEIGGFNGFRFNPTAVLRAHNRFQGQPRERSQQQLLTLAEDPRYSDNTLIVARVLYVSNASQRYPVLQHGRPDIEPPSLEAFPIFPLHITRDTPFLLIGGYILGGEPPPVREYLLWCARECHVRPAQLTPEDDPLATVDSLLQSDEWKRVTLQPAHVAMLRLQALRAVRRVYPLSAADEQALIASASDHGWGEHRRAFAALGAHWNPRLNDFEI